MKTPIVTILLAISTLHAAEHNPAIDYHGFLKDAARVEKIRDRSRVSEEEFLRMAAEPGTIILDARSADKFAMLHVVGARNLPLPDFSTSALAQLIPDKATRILIYCNNNFQGEERAMASKRAPTSLNIYTFNSLYGYGYRNVHELAPLRDVRASKLPFGGTLASSIRSGHRPFGLPSIENTAVARIITVPSPREALGTSAK